MPKSLTISQDDSFFPDYLDFEALRIKGREHIAKFSGEIWSDHNVHDPGITIMEVLAYAILDIGYRNQLPDEELFAWDRTKGGEEDNFFTAAQILSCNPLTINDFRKLIIDINGVRNAWLEVTDQAEVDLVIDCDQSQLLFKDDTNDHLLPLQLNGLYKVYLELEPKEILALTGLEATAIVQEVKCTLFEHRNLCEDFVEVKVLEDEEIAVCAEIELTSNADPDDTMVKVLEKIDNFLSPSITFYTLEQLLAKGKTMDEIFEGRPLKTASNGFIDVEELEQFDRIREIHVSDLYREIMDIPEVRGIKNLILQSFINGQSKSGSEKWCLKIEKNRRPVLAASRAQFTFYKNVLPFFPNTSVAIERFKKRLSNVRKARLQPYQLDAIPPLGSFRGDLANYKSIQHEFPVVYGIGDGHLSQSASDTRKAQALQLKGYLLFFDQLLANYLSQLANIRSLFSLKPVLETTAGCESTRSYFTQQLQDVPGAEKLIRFYDNENVSNEASGAIATWSPASASLPIRPETRDYAIHKAIQSFRSNLLSVFVIQQEADWSYYSIKKLDQFGLRFQGNTQTYATPEAAKAAIYAYIQSFQSTLNFLLILPNQTTKDYGFEIADQLGHPFLKSIHRYPNSDEALEKAEPIRFFATLEEAYRPFVETNETTYRREFSYVLLNNPVNYWTYLNKIIESDEECVRRKDSFLNHLLARFSEHFTDYTLLMFALNGQSHDLNKMVQDKSRFLYHYPEISRNRGTAYNYSAEDAIWNTDNISGLERRVTAMMGIPDFTRHTLSNFQISGPDEDIYYYRLFHEGVAMFISQYAYPSKNKAKSKLRALFNLSKSEANYQKIDCEASNAYTFKIVDKNNDDNEAIHPGTYPTKELRDEMIQKLITELKLNIYDELTTVNPTVTISEDGGGQSNTTPPASQMGLAARRRRRQQLKTNSPSAERTTNPISRVFPSSPSASRASTNPPGSGSGSPPTIQPTNPVTPPYTLTGNIFVKTDACDILDAEETFTYRIIDEEELCAWHPETFASADVEDAKKELEEKLENIDQQYSRLCFGANKVVFLEGTDYHFQLSEMNTETATDPNTGEEIQVFVDTILWRSCEKFASFEEAYQAFQNEFLTVIELAQHAENYTVETEGDVEILKLGQEQADCLAFVPSEVLAGKTLDEAKSERLLHAQKFPVGRVEFSDENKVEEKARICKVEMVQLPEVCEEQAPVFRFHLVKSFDDQTFDWISTSVFDEPLAAWDAFLQCLELIKDDVHWIITEEENGKMGLAVGEVLLKGTHSYGSELSAWNATKEFATHFKEDYGLHAFTDFWSGCYCSFRVVNEMFHLANHPYCYTTTEERDLMLDYLRKTAQEKEKFFELVFPDTEPASASANFLNIFSESGELLWQGCKSFENKSDIEVQYEENHISIMNLAQSAKNYDFVKAGDQCRVALRNAQGAIVAVIPQLFEQEQSELRLDEIVKRIRLARQFPIKETPGGFRFEIYDLDFIFPALPDEEEDSDDNSANTPVHSKTSMPTSPPSDCGVEEKAYLINHVNEQVGGGIILEGIRNYASREEMYEIIKWLENHSFLFRQLDSYQPTESDDCGPFSIEWINPGGIVAESPRRFSTVSECQAAIDCSKEKVNGEGLHLIEHLLLRPLGGQADSYVYQIVDSLGNPLFYGDKEYESQALAESDKSRFIFRTTEAAKKLYRRLRKKSVLEQTWIQAFQLEDEEGVLIDTLIQIPPNKETFKEHINSLRNLSADAVECIQLKNKRNNERLLDICVDAKACGPQASPKIIERCGDTFIEEESLFEHYIHGADPYSFWVSIIIPYWPRRFQNLNFRAFFENTIRRELPAYVAPRIVWVNPLDMKLFESAYQSWLQAKADVVREKTLLESAKLATGGADCIDVPLDSPTDNSNLQVALQALEAAQTILISVLEELENEYPLARLQPFESGGSNNIVLNQTKLV